MKFSMLSKAPEPQQCNKLPYIGKFCCACCKLLNFVFSDPKLSFLLQIVL